MSIKETLKILDEIEQLLEFTEEPDAFETESEKHMEKELEKKFDKELLQGYKKPTAKEAILSNLYTFFKKFKFIRDLQLYENRVQFWMPYKQRDWLWEWEDKSNARKNAGLKAHTYNSSEGYIVEIS